MDSTVIEEIAKQLGMAVDQTGAFIAEYLPDFAALKAMQATVPIIGSAVILAVGIVVAVVSGLVLMAVVKKSAAKVVYWNDYISYWVLCISAMVAIVGLIAIVVALGACLPEIIGWQSYPEAMLIDMAIGAIK